MSYSMVLNRCGAILAPVIALLLLVSQASAEDWTPLWTTASLSQPRARLSATAAGGKVLFAGGYNASGYSDVVDIYDVANGTWASSNFSPQIQRRLIQSLMFQRVRPYKINFSEGGKLAKNGPERPFAAPLTAMQLQ